MGVLKPYGNPITVAHSHTFLEQRPLGKTTSCCPLPLPIVGNPTGHLMNTLPLGMLVWLLDFFFNYKYKLLQILTHFSFLLCVLVCVYVGGGALMHACGGHTHCVLMIVLTSYSSPAPLWDPRSNSGCHFCLEVSLSAICRAISPAPLFHFQHVC